MFYPQFGATEGRVTDLNPERELGVIEVMTPNGTATPSKERLAFDFKLGRKPSTALELGITPVNELLHFGKESPERSPQVGDRLMYTMDTQPKSADRLALQRVDLWCYAEDWHQLRLSLDELRMLVEGQPPKVFTQILDLMGRIERKELTIPDNARWQRRPGVGTNRGYSGALAFSTELEDGTIRGPETEMGWEDCPDPRLSLMS